MSLFGAKSNYITWIFKLANKQSEGPHRRVHNSDTILWSGIIMCPPNHFFPPPNSSSSNMHITLKAPLSIWNSATDAQLWSADLSLWRTSVPCWQDLMIAAVFSWCPPWQKFLSFLRNCHILLLSFYSCLPLPLCSFGTAATSFLTRSGLKYLEGTRLAKDDLSWYFKSAEKVHTHTHTHAFVCPAIVQKAAGMVPYKLPVKPMLKSLSVTFSH